MHRLTKLALLCAIMSMTAFGDAGAAVDGRVYELVSPAQKSGGVGGVFPPGSLTFSLEQFHYPLQSSLDGSGIAYQGEDFYQPRLGSLNQYLSFRNQDGWSTLNSTPGVPSATEGFGRNPFVGFSPQLSIGILGSEDLLTEDAPKGYANLYLVEGTSRQPLVRNTPPNRTAKTFGYAYTEPGASRVKRELLFAGGNYGTERIPSFSHVLFAANDALTQATATAPAAVDGGMLENNLYEWVNGDLRLVNILPDGETEPGASFGVDYADVYNNEPLPNLSHVISADGSKIFWTNENSNGPNNSNLYVREDGIRTTLIAFGGQFQTASTDGNRAFFTKEGHLYEYYVDARATTELGGGDGVEGVAGASEDGRYVYFVSARPLAGNAQEGQPNLYLSHESTPGEYTVSLIATLLPEDNHTPELYGTGGTPEGDWYRTFAGRTAEVSPNGRYIAFISQKSLTGYDNADAVFPNRDDEIFLYDSETAKLTCISCNIDEKQPTADALLPAPVNGVYQPRYLNDSGRMFFSTANAVLKQDTNGSSDVYEYEGGRVYLISPGKAADEAIFADASENGDDVFFTTREQLVPGDGDQIVDLYDARVDGAAEAPSASPCLDEACHTFPVAPPSFEAPVSTIFVGSGNIAAPISGPPKTVKKKMAKKRHVKHAKRGRHARGRTRRAKSRG